MRIVLCWVLGVAAATVLLGCSDQGGSVPDASEAAGVVNLYSSRHYDTDLALYERFTEKTGIKVNRIEAEADALIERIQAEDSYSPADLLITVDAGRLWRAQQAGIFSAVQTDVLSQRVPANLRHPDGLWYGLSKRVRVIIYNKAAGKPPKLADYQDLADPALKGQVCIRSSSNIYNISLLAGLVSHLGVEAAEEWAKGVVANFARRPQSNDTGQIKSVASGECRVALVNSYYLARMIEAGDAATSAVGVIFPNQASTGAHVNISGAGVLRYAPNRANATAFLEYLTSDEAQGYFASGNHEYPVVGAVAPTSALQSLGTFKEDQLNASELGIHQAEAVRIFDRAGWQ